mgnify:CR=1 FL=1
MGTAKEGISSVTPQARRGWKPLRKILPPPPSAAPPSMRGLSPKAIGGVAILSRTSGVTTLAETALAVVESKQAPPGDKPPPQAAD